MTVTCVSRKLDFQGCQISTELTLTVIKKKQPTALTHKYAVNVSYLQESAVLHIYIYTVVSMDVFSPKTPLSEVICSLLGGYLGVLN